MRGNCCASSSPSVVSGCDSCKLPIIDVIVRGKKLKGLIDTGCSHTLAKANLLERVEGPCFVRSFSGEKVLCEGSGLLNMDINGTKICVGATGTKKMLDGVDVIIGMDVIGRIGPLHIGKDQVCFGVRNNQVNTVATVVNDSQDLINSIENKDFCAKFDGNVWTVEWKWINNIAPVLCNKVELYENGKSPEIKESFEKEVDRWVEEGILVPWEGKVDSVLPLMAVVQPTKQKVRPVIDFREINKHVECHTGGDEINICQDKLREWRKTRGEIELVDLQHAYLQIRVDKKLWKHQLVRHNGVTYALTRLGFGLNVAPKIMAVVLKWVLDQDDKVKEATSSYIDDILVNTSKTSSNSVVSHLGQYGLKSKSPECLDGGAALGLKLRKLADGSYMFSRGNQVPEIPDKLSRRELFSICGKLVGHYPVAGWLRVASSFMKRSAEGAGWEDDVGVVAQRMLKDVQERVRTEDPVKGAWTVPHGESGTIWCDASSIAIGTLLEVGGVVVEDRAWLRKLDDFNHINVAELESVLKGVNLAIEWGVTELRIMTDSSTVKAWVELTISEDRPIKSKGAAEVLVKRRLGVLKSLVEEVGISIKVELTESKKNKADILTRVPKEWLKAEKGTCSVGVLEEVHSKAHMGVDRTLQLARRLDPQIEKTEVQKHVRACIKCQSIDPAPVKHERGHLSVEKAWSRLAIDVVHYQSIPYLSMVDCGPGRFTIWRELKRETARCICMEIEQIFRERGPVDEVILDNALCFRSRELEDIFKYWKIRVLYRAAYRASGNSIVERNHRTIKCWAEKAGIDPIEAVFWYNVSPRVSDDSGSLPQLAVNNYRWRLPLEEPELDTREVSCRFDVGDDVWVKPGQTRCTTKWNRGKVTEVSSTNNVSVDGMPRHVLDLRRVYVAEDSSSEVEEEGEREEEEERVERQPTPLEPRRSVRVRQPPRWMSDYVSH